MIHVLLVEDDDIDAALVQDEFKKITVRVKVSRVRDGNECMAYLHDPTKRRPDVIFLDLKMPVMTGREVLAEMMAEPRFRIIPVVVISGSDVDADRLKAYELGANGYVTKPVEGDKYVELFQDVWKYWLKRNRPPP